MSLLTPIVGARYKLVQQQQYLTSLSGGYAFHETSSEPGSGAKMAVMESNMQEPTGASGKCLKFWYSIDGLSAQELKVSAYRSELGNTFSMKYKSRKTILNISFLIITSIDILKVRVKGVDSPDSLIIWETRDSTRGDWKEGQALYTFAQNHSVSIFIWLCYMQC